MVRFFRFLGSAVGTPLLPEPERAIVDAVVLSGGPECGSERGCALDGVILDGDDGWRLNETTGRFEPVDPDKVCCPKG